MTRCKYMMSALHYSIKKIWRGTFIIISICGAVFGLRWYVLEPRSILVVFEALQRFGVNVKAKNATLTWKWGKRPVLFLKCFHWSNDSTSLKIAYAQGEIRFNRKHPLRKLTLDGVDFDYSEQQLELQNYLGIWKEGIALLGRVARVKQCALNNIRIYKNHVLQAEVNKVSWSLAQEPYKIFGKIYHADWGNVTWSYHPKTLRFLANIENGVGSFARVLGCTYLKKHPLSLDFAFNEKGTKIVASWDKNFFLVGKERHDLQASRVYIDIHEQSAQVQGTLGVDGLSLAFKGKYDTAWTLKWNSTNSLSIKHLKFWWNKSWGPYAKEWVDEHFHSEKGDVRNVQGCISGIGADVQYLNGSFEIAGAYLQILQGMPEVQKIHSKAEFTLNQFNFYIKKALFSKQKVCSGTVRISDLTGDSKLALGVRLEGGVDDIIKILGCKQLDVAKNLPLRNVYGKAYTFLRMKFPLILDLKLHDIVLDYESGFDNAKFTIDIFGASLLHEKGKIYIKGSLNALAVEGRGTIDQYPTVWCWKGMFGDASHQKLTVEAWVNPRVWMPHWTKDWIRESSIPVNLTYFPNKGRVEARSDLSKTSINIPWIQWAKKSFVPFSLKCSFLEKTKEIVFTSKGAVESEGKLRLAEKVTGWAKIHIPKVFQMFVKTALNLRNIEINSKYLDLEAIRKAMQENTPPKVVLNTKQLLDMHAKVNIQKTKWSKDITLDRLRGNLNWSQPNKLFDQVDLEEFGWANSDLQCLMRSKKCVSTIHFLTLPERSKTGIKLIVRDLGGLSYFAGIQDNIPYGESGEWIGSQYKDGSYQGVLTCRDVVTRGLWMGKILSFLSPVALTELLHSSLDFSEISVKCSYKKKILHLKQGVAKGLNLGAFLKGDIHIQTGKLFLQGGVVPAYFLNTLFSKIPLVGALLGEEKGILSSKFIVTGTLENPIFSVNPLSILELGGLKALFE